MTTLAPKDPNTDTRYAIDARAAVTPVMRRDWPYSVGQIVKAPLHTGWYYEATTAGETEARVPRLPRADGETVQDGSVEWTARHPSSASLPSISAVEWIVEPAGELSVLSEQISHGILYPLLSGGVDGTQYEVTARVTWSIAGGQQVEDVTVTIQVAQL